MATRERSRDRGTRLARGSLASIGEEVRRARLGAGLSQATVAGVVGVSHTTIGRVERAELPGVAIVVLARTCAAVGLDLVVRSYPAGDPVRDVAQLTLLDRLRRRLPPTIPWRVEVPLPIPGDLRAWDAVIGPIGSEIALEAETRIADVQALERRINRKQRDGRVDRVVILIADTRANRRALALGRDALRGTYPLDTREILAALADGRQPPANGVVIL